MFQKTKENHFFYKYLLHILKYLINDIFSYKLRNIIKERKCIITFSIKYFLKNKNKYINIIHKKSVIFFFTYLKGLEAVIY